MDINTLLLLLVVGLVVYMVLGRQGAASEGTQEQNKRGGGAPASAGDENIFDTLLGAVSNIINSLTRKASPGASNT